MMSEKILLSDVIATSNRAFKYILSQYRLILKVTLVTTLMALVYGLLQPKSYKAVATFILEEKSGSKSGLGALASQIGFDIGSLTGGGAGLFDGDNIIDIMQSRLIIEKVLLSKVDSTKGATSTTLGDLYISTNHINKKWEQDPYLKGFSFSNLKDTDAHTQLQDSILYTLFQKVAKNNLAVSRQNKKGSIISIQVNSKSQEFSKVFTERLLKETSDLYFEIKTGNVNNNITRLQNKADSLQSMLYTKSYQAASLVNANTGIRSYAASEEMSQKDKTVLYTLYTEVMKNLEALKLSLISQTPVIQILDTPKYPLVNQNTPLILILLIGIGAGLVLSIVIAVYLYTDKVN